MTRKKKLLLILSALCIVTALSACGEDPSATLDPDYNASAASGVSPEIESGKADAAILNNDCMMVFSGIKMGRINNETKDSKGEAVTWAPEKDTNDTMRLKAAENTTISQVLEYTDTNYDLSVMVYVTKEFSDNYKGKILYIKDPVAEKNKDRVAPLKRNSTLGKLYA